MGVFADKGKPLPVRFQRVDYGRSDRHGTTIDTDVTESAVDQVISVAVPLIVAGKERTAQQEQPKRNQNFIHTYYYISGLQRTPIPLCHARITCQRPISLNQRQMLPCQRLFKGKKSFYHPDPSVYRIRKPVYRFNLQEKGKPRFFASENNKEHV